MVTKVTGVKKAMAKKQLGKDFNPIEKLSGKGLNGDIGGKSKK